MAESERLVRFSWCHYMLSSIQQGIQHGHCGDEMSLKYRHKRDNMYWEWLRNHKTVNVRNGGDSNKLKEIMQLFNSPENKYPWGYFKEDSSLECALTCVSVVLPDSVFAWEATFGLHRQAITFFNEGGEQDKYITNPLDTYDQKLYDLIKSTRFAT